MIRQIPIIVGQTITSAFAGLIWLFIPFAAVAQEAAAPPPSSDYVSRAEYDKLKAEHEAEHEAMKQEMEALKTTVRQMANGMAPAAPAEGPAPAAKSSEGEQVTTNKIGQPATDGKSVATNKTGQAASDAGCKSFCR